MRIRLLPRTKYVCPMLMALTGLLKGGHWRKDSTGIWYVVKGYSEMLCAFPQWMVAAECRFWNSGVGMRLR